MRYERHNEGLMTCYGVGNASLFPRYERVTPNNGIASGIRVPYYPLSTIDGSPEGKAPFLDVVGFAGCSAVDFPDVVRSTAAFEG